MVESVASNRSYVAASPSRMLRMQLMAKAELGDITLDYSVRGEGHPVLGIMGFALDKRFWAAQIPPITKKNKFITFDNRGIGWSTGDVATTIDQMADDAYRLLDHLEIEKAVIFGVSMGGAIAQRLVLDHPDRVSGAIFAVTFARPIEFMRRQHELSRSLIQALGTEALMDAALIRMFTPQFFEMGREMIDRMVASFMVDDSAIASPEALLGQLDALDKHDTIDQLPSITVPTLVLGGKMDQMVPYLGSQEIANAIPNSEFVTFETGHGCMIEEMEPFNQKIEEFLAQFSD
jgi:3-oxoadipate enol-lactonase